MGVTINHTEVPTHKTLLQTSLSHGFLQKLVQNKPKLKPSTQIKDSDLKVQDGTENKCVQEQGLPPSHSHTEMHANTVSLQITNLAVGFILRPFWRGSNTVTAIPSNPLPTVTTQTQILRLTKTISATENGIIMRICLRTFILFTKLEAKSEASIQPQTNSFSLFHRATLQPTMGVQIADYRFNVLYHICVEEVSATVPTPTFSSKSYREKSHKNLYFIWEKVE